MDKVIFSYGFHAPGIWLALEISKKKFPEISLEMVETPWKHCWRYHMVFPDVKENVRQRRMSICKIKKNINFKSLLLPSIAKVTNSLFKAQSLSWRVIATDTAIFSYGFHAPFGHLGGMPKLPKEVSGTSLEMAYWNALETLYGMAGGVSRRFGYWDVAKPVISCN